MNFPTDQHIKGYEIKERVGAGGFGAVSSKRGGNERQWRRSVMLVVIF